MSCPAHPLVDKHGVRSHFIRNDHSLEGVCLKKVAWYAEFKVFWYCIRLVGTELLKLTLLHLHTVLLALAIPPAKDTFFQVAMIACFGSNVSVPTYRTKSLCKKLIILKTK